MSYFRCCIFLWGVFFALPVLGNDSCDPFETYNRAMYSFNGQVDAFIFKPVAIAYDFIFPSIVKMGVRNIFSNIEQIPMVANNLLQGEPKKALINTTRFVANTTFGILGAFDVADCGGLYRQEADFGQTLAKWGYRHSSYFVLPLLGPTTVRDSFGKAGDFFMSPWAYWNKNRYWWGAHAIEWISIRSTLLDKEKIFQAMVIDEYAVVRQAILDRRNNLIESGDSRFDDPSDDFDRQSDGS
jgi:phospholipid-binding lipoprotein MlaA